MRNVLIYRCCQLDSCHRLLLAILTCIDVVLRTIWNRVDRVDWWNSLDWRFSCSRYLSRFRRINRCWLKKTFDYLEWCDWVDEHHGEWRIAFLSNGDCRLWQNCSWVISFTHGNDCILERRWRVLIGSWHSNFFDRLWVIRIWANWGIVYLDWMIVWAIVWNWYVWSFIIRKGCSSLYFWVIFELFS